MLIESNKERLIPFVNNRNEIDYFKSVLMEHGLIYSERALDLIEFMVSKEEFFTSGGSLNVNDLLHHTYFKNGAFKKYNRFTFSRSIMILIRGGLVIKFEEKKDGKQSVSYKFKQEICDYFTEKSVA